ncbi:alpha/beta hydrolase [Rhodococcus sp. BP-349]|uniref:alpha/beta hydrolase n=1 Tax=unclassified Rhodococcus (in: high G+C Gram-positive bacteria) TaxID=192944 RepID=UPI001C9BB853|nr:MULTISPECIES: alpha/beta hydrolase [unclassified Rhodococcus (in: high G+C Gram-positive bacteria)]MBY6537854.1 alpha/beta hydrolase [Rhodococcus sp. BP-363]MBY6542191.1 alpha/beta hydrolase [Rhodococcus sp. BP-369]MBY6561421.1 alpha/beta hydrolase [Rhodococcus sp. BP-370]MBY6575713.1 alpha/beta hydrolase [Rhodococcus sp. BP-364]MBY6585014.1 alpha/beta hydrolase [Rhodococcus sp. BP-358]
MAVDEHVTQLLTGLDAQGVPPFSQMPLEQIRETIAGFTGMQLPPEDVAGFTETEYLGVDGNSRPLRIYTPDVPGPRPIVLYFHGGGFIAGNLDVVDEPARAIANASGAIVVTASYRLAPEHPFPAASDDAAAALQWVADNVSAHGGDPENIILLGDSAGGNLAASAALRARDTGGPRVNGLVLIYPALNPNANLPSRAEFGEGFLIGSADLDFFWTSYLQEPEDASNPYAVPPLADLAGLPATLVLTTENEVTRDEGEQFADALRAAGVQCRNTRFDGLVHGVFWLSAAVPRGRELLDAATQFIREVSVAAPAR